jgi:DivIVA domain-containing protein
MEMATEPPMAERIRELTFPRSWAWRGYDAAEVDKFLDRLAGWLEGDRGGRERLDSPEMEGEVIATLERTIGDLEREVANGKRRESRLIAKLEEARTRLEAARESGAAPRAPARPRSGRATRRRARTPQRLDLNKASFVDLRHLGVGVAGAARLIAMRDIRGGFENLDVLDELEGYPDATIQKLRRRLYVEAGDRGAEPPR